MPMPRSLAVIVVAILAVLTSAAPATAHITVNPREAPKGGFAKLGFRVPNERSDSGTVKVDVAFPAEHPFTSVSVKPTPGWTFSVQKTPLDEPVESHGRTITESVSQVTWEGGVINPGEFQEFEVSAGRMPEDADELVFKAIQTYASGEVVRWIEEATPGGEEPEEPAPVLTLVESDAGHGAGGGDQEEAAEAETAPIASEAAIGLEAGNVASQGEVATATRLAVAALIVGGLGLAAAGAGLLRRQRARSSDA